MSDSTPELDLYQPAGSEFVNVVQDLNDNLEKIDNFAASLNDYYPIPRPAMQCHQTVAQTFATGVDEAITFDGEFYDNINGHTTGGNNTRYTPTVPGYYACDGQAAYVSTDSDGNRGAQFRKNGAIDAGAPFSGVHAQAGTDIAGTATAHGLIACNGTTDYIELWGYQSCGVDLDTVVDANVRSYMRIMFVAPL